MSERKVLNKYYPPDFDPSKIPRLKLKTDRQYTVRLMAPFNMKCKTCGEYIYKGKKFNARKETVSGADYLGIKIFRFYIKCTRCLAEITFKTDPQNADYEMEHGATRNFQALRLAEEQAEREAKELEEEATGNPMKMLENRTKQSKQEMQLLETLEDMRELNQRHARIDHELLLQMNEVKQKQEIEKQEEEDENFVKSMFGSESLRRLPDPISDEHVHQAARKRVQSVLQTDDFGPSKISKSDPLDKLSKIIMLKPKKPKIETKEPEVKNSSSSAEGASSTVTGLSLLAGYGDDLSEEDSS